MEYKKNKITNRQLFFIIFLTLSSYTTIDLPKQIAESAGRMSWIPIIIMSLLFGVFAVVITKLNNMYKGKVFYDYSKNITGKFFSYIICFYYLIYLIIIGIYLKLKLVGLLNNNFLPKTPQMVILIFGIALFGYIAHKGITNIARIFEIIGVLFLAVTVILCIFMLIEGMKENILPLFNLSEIKNVMTGMESLVTSYGGLGVLLVIPFTKENKKASKTAFFTLLFIGLFYVLIVESTIMILGINNTISFNNAFVEAIKVVEMPVIERTDIFYLTFGLTSLFAGIVIVYAVVLDLACKLFPKIKRIILTLIISLLFFVLSMYALNIINTIKTFESVTSYLVFISSIMIPLILFIVAKIKK